MQRQTTEADWGHFVLGVMTYELLLGLMTCVLWVMPYDL